MDQIVVEFWLEGEDDMWHWQHYKLGCPIPRVGEEIVFGPPHGSIHTGTVTKVMTDMTRNIPSVSLWIKAV